jgi:hypothetical protein
MKVRALPTWRNPVGEGAKRTLGLLDALLDRLLKEDEFMDSDMRGQERSAVGLAIRTNFRWCELQHELQYELRWYGHAIGIVKQTAITIWYANL